MLPSAYYRAQAETGRDEYFVMGQRGPDEPYLLLLPRSEAGTMAEIAAELANRRAVVIESKSPHTPFFIERDEPVASSERYGLYKLNENELELARRWLLDLDPLGTQTFNEIKAAHEKLHVENVKYTVERRGESLAMNFDATVSATTMLAALGWMFANIVAAGLGPQMRRCHLPTCKRFFVGNPSSKWCAPRCSNYAGTMAHRAGMTKDQWINKQRRRKR